MRIFVVAVLGAVVALAGIIVQVTFDPRWLGGWRLSVCLVAIAVLVGGLIWREIAKRPIATSHPQRAFLKVADDIKGMRIDSNEIPPDVDLLDAGGKVTNADVSNNKATTSPKKYNSISWLLIGILVAIIVAGSALTLFGPHFGN